jgi:hypothetical protein
MPRTSDRVSSIAARMVHLQPDTLLGLTATPGLRDNTARDIRSMAASLLAQDEYRGLRGFIRKVTGK